MNIDNLSLKEKIGQMCIVGINSNKIEPLYNLIKESKIGGVILYKKNYSSYEELINVVKSLKEANKGNKIPLFISIDQEGGKVNRMPNVFSNVKNVYDLSYVSDIKLIRRASDVSSKMLVESGINMNFAPVLDIYNELNSSSKVLFKRCFSDDVNIVSKFGTCYMKQMQRNNIIPVVKHFPGHGSSSKDSHIFIPYIKDYDEILNKHILPFEEVIKNGCDAIMIGHLVIKNLTEGLPASISRNFILNYLRNRYSYNGVVITDDIKMGSVSLFYKFTAFEKAFSSGSDIILFKYNNGDEKVINRIVDKVNNGKISIKDINNSVDRILKLKEKYKINDDIDFVGCNVEQINKEINSINRNYEEGIKNGKK